MKKQESGILFFSFLLLIPIGLYLFLGLYANPIADDFTYAHTGYSKPISEALIDEYLNWNGRYTSNFFVLINPVSFGYEYLWIYKCIPALIIILTIFSTFLLLKAIAGDYLNNKKNILLSLVVSLVFLQGMPDIAEGIYWYTASVTYQLGLIFFLLFASVFVLYLKDRIFISKPVHFVTLTVLLFLTAGFNECILLISILFLFISLIISLQKRKFVPFTVSLFFFSIAYFAIVYFAPGNSVRESYFPDNHRLFHSLGYSFLQIARFSAQWIPVLILPSVLFLSEIDELNRKIPVIKKSFFLNPVTSTLILPAIVFLAVFPAYWATGILGQHRTVNVAFFLFIIFWFVNLTVWANSYVFRNARIVLSGKLKRRIFILLFLILIFSGNTFNAIRDISESRAHNYNRIMNERAETILNGVSETTDTIYFEKIIDPPATLFVLDITDNPDDWANRGYNLYFNKEEIILPYNQKAR